MNAAKNESEDLAKAFTATCSSIQKIGDGNDEFLGAPPTSHADRIQILAEIQVILHKLSDSLEREREKNKLLESELAATRQQIACVEAEKVGLEQSTSKELRTISDALLNLHTAGLQFHTTRPRTSATAPEEATTQLQLIAEVKSQLVKLSAENRQLEQSDDQGIPPHAIYYN